MNKEMNTISDFELLSLDRNATIEDIQLSFAYLYRIIDLMYPLNGKGEAGEERSIELKKLETAYLSTLNKLRKEFIITSDLKEGHIKSELDKIENFLSNEKIYSIKPFMKGEYSSNNKPIRKYPFFKLDKHRYHVLYIDELEICISAIISNSCGETIKGELHIPDIPPLIIVGKIIKKEQEKITARLVTRIANKWVQKFKKEKGLKWD